MPHVTEYSNQITSDPLTVPSVVHLTNGFLPGSQPARTLCTAPFLFLSPRQRFSLKFDVIIQHSLPFVNALLSVYKNILAEKRMFDLIVPFAAKLFFTLFLLVFVLHCGFL